MTSPKWSRSLLCSLLLATFLVAPGLAGEGAQTKPAASPSSFLLLLHEDSTYQACPPEQLPARIQEYSKWANQLAERGQMVAAEKLQDTGMVLTNGSERPAKAEELPGGNPGGVAGYFVIQADDYPAAAKIAATCPHLKYGGKILLREIHQLQ